MKILVFRLLAGVVGILAALWAGELFVAGINILYVVTLSVSACGLLLVATGGVKLSKPK